MTLNKEKRLIYLITSGEATDSNFAEKRIEIVDLARVAVGANISLIQIREKQLSARSLFELTSSVAAITRGTATRLLVNDRADVALAAGADGVHLSVNSLPVKVIRAAFPTGFLVGASTHSMSETVRVATDGADLAVFGPVFDTPGKGTPTGLAVLADVCAGLSPFPVIGLGGINLLNYESVLAAGSAGFAGIRAFADTESLRSITARLRR